MSYDQFTGALQAAGFNTPSDAINMYSYFKNTSLHYGITTSTETTMFLAQMTVESNGLTEVREMDCLTTNCTTEYRIPGDPSNVYYFGRGYMQITWSDNYQQASQDILGMDTLYYYPDFVAQVPGLSWMTAGWFWQTFVHEVAITGQFGLTTLEINGSLECGGGTEVEFAKERYAIYKQMLAVVAPNETPVETGCYN